MGMDDSERTALLERIDGIERSLARGEEGLESYGRAFAKLRAEIEDVRAQLDAGPSADEPQPAVVLDLPAQPPMPTVPPVVVESQSAPTPELELPPPRPAAPPPPPRRSPDSSRRSGPRLRCAGVRR